MTTKSCSDVYSTSRGNLICVIAVSCTRTGPLLSGINFYENPWPCHFLRLVHPCFLSRLIKHDAEG